MAEWTPILKDAACIRKHPKPILTKDDIPYEAEFVFNAGVAKVGGRYVMVFRDDYGATEKEYLAREKYISKTAVGKEIDGRGQKGWDTWWNKRYTAGIMLLDLKNPYKIIGMSKSPVIAPSLPWETDEGFRTNVIFPGGMIAEDDGCRRFARAFLLLLCGHGRRHRG